MSDNQLIKVFNEYYVGFQERSRSEIIDESKSPSRDNYKQIPYSLAFLTPYETNAAGEKRKATVDRWAGEWNYEFVMENGKQVHKKKVKPEHLKSKVIKNEMVEGFRLAEDVRRTYWGGGNVVWRVEDPRGWEFEISSANLARIIEEVGIQPGGVIPGKCILGRIGANNILIPDGTEYWKKATLDAEEIERRSKVVSKNEVVIGSICELKTGTTKVYMGHYFVSMLHCPEFGYRTDHWRSKQRSLTELLEDNLSGNHQLTTDKYHVFKSEKTDEIVLYKEKKVVSVKGNDETFSNEAECLEFLNQNKARALFANSSKYSYGISAFIFTKEKPQKVNFELQDIAEDQLLSRISIGKHDSRISISGGGYNWSQTLIDEKEGHCLNDLTVLGQRINETINGRFRPVYSNNKLVASKDNLKAVFASKYKVNDSHLEKIINIPLANRNHYFSYNIETTGEIIVPNSFDNGLDILNDAVKQAIDTYNFKLLTVNIDGTKVIVRM